MMDLYNTTRSLSFAIVISFGLIFPLTVFGQGFKNNAIEVGIDMGHRHASYMGGGVAIFDYDRDGYEDIYLTGGKEFDYLFKNNGDGSYTNVAEEAGIVLDDEIYTTSVITGDINNDGYREIFVTSWTNQSQGGLHPNLLYLNNGDGTFTEIGAQAGISDADMTMGATFLDYNKDSYLDLYTVSYIENPIFIDDSTGVTIGFAHECYANHFYINNGDGTFTEIGDSLGLANTGCALAVTATDFDQDDDVDIYLANDFGEFIQPNSLFENQYPENHFEDVGPSNGMDVGLYGMGVAIGDYDLDSDMDYYITNLGRNVLLNNDGNNVFTDVTTFAGVENTYADTSDLETKLRATSWGTAFFDYDNDMYLDLYVSNGFIPADAFIATSFRDPNILYRNNGDGTFEDVTHLISSGDEQICRGMAYADLNMDGKLDMVVVALRRSGTVDTSRTRIYINETENDHNWIKVNLEGVQTNRDAYGSYVHIYSGDQHFMQEVYGGSSFASQHSTILHFGLGELEEVDSVQVDWLGGKLQTIMTPPINELLEIKEDTTTQTTTSLFDWQQTTDFQLSALPNPFSQNTTITYELPFRSSISLLAIDPLGKQIPIIQSEDQQAGRYQFSLSEENFKLLQQGLYIIQLKTEAGVQSIKLIHAK